MAKKPRYSIDQYLSDMDGEASYEDYTALAKSAGALYMDPNSFAKAMAPAEDDDGDDDEEEEEEETAKSGAADVPVDALLKSLHDYDAVEDAIGATPEQAREAVLTAKLSSEGLSKSERAELAGILGGGAEAGEPLRKSVADQIRAESNEAADLVDASTFLTALTDSIEKSLGHVFDEISAEGDTTRQLVKAQGQIVRTMGSVVGQLHEQLAKSATMIGALHARLEQVEATPVAPRAVGRHGRSAVAQRNLAKSGAAGRAGAGDDDALSKSEVMGALSAMCKAAVDKQDDRAMAILSQATAKFESGFGLTRAVDAAVRAHLGRA